jgi:hypothetical protein
MAFSFVRVGACNLPTDYARSCSQENEWYVALPCWGCTFILMELGLAGVEKWLVSLPEADVCWQLCQSSVRFRLMSCI